MIIKNSSSSNDIEDTAMSFDGLIVDRISLALRKDILAGAIPEGEPLRQDSIAKRFETSRVPVREALRSLEAEGLVVFHPRRGASVASVDPNQILEMYDIRIALECGLLRLAIPKMSSRDIDEANAMLAEYELAGDEIEPETWDDLNWRFHARLYIPAHRPAMFTLARNNYYKQARSVRVRIAIATGYSGPHQEHREIVSACAHGNVEQASALLETHLVNAKKSVATQMHLADLGSRAQI